MINLNIKNTEEKSPLSLGIHLNLKFELIHRVFSQLLFMNSGKVHLSKFKRRTRLSIESQSIYKLTNDYKNQISFSFASERSEPNKKSTMKIVFGILTIILLFITLAIGSPEPGFSRPGLPGGFHGHPPPGFPRPGYPRPGFQYPGHPPFINRPFPPPKLPPYA